MQQRGIIREAVKNVVVTDYCQEMTCSRSSLLVLNTGRKAGEEQKTLYQKSLAPAFNSEAAYFKPR